MFKKFEANSYTSLFYGTHETYQKQIFLKWLARAQKISIVFFITSFYPAQRKTMRAFLSFHLSTETQSYSIPSAEKLHVNHSYEPGQPVVAIKVDFNSQRVEATEHLFSTHTVISIHWAFTAYISGAAHWHKYILWMFIMRQGLIPEIYRCISFLKRVQLS